MLTPWKPDRILIDPFCGSGTFPIEAAMIAANIAPGMNRRFTSLRWTNIINSELWDDAVEEAEDLINLSVDTDIQGFDIDENVIKIARSNAANAGVEKLIHFQARSVAELSHHKKYGFIITNPHMAKDWRTRKHFLLYILRLESSLQSLIHGQHI